VGGGVAVYRESFAFEMKLGDLEDSAGGGVSEFGIDIRTGLMGEVKEEGSVAADDDVAVMTTVAVGGKAAWLGGFVEEIRLGTPVFEIGGTVDADAFSVVG